MRHVHECTLRWSDMDAYGHLNNSRFLTLYEEARVALFFLGGRGAVGSFVISRHEVDYLRPVDFATGPDGAPRPPVVRVESWIDEVRPWGGVKVPGAPTDPIDAFLAGMRELKLTNGRIGMELGYGQRVGMPQTDVDAFRAAFPDAQIQVHPFKLER